VHLGITQRVFQKVVYVQWSHVRLLVWFAERTFDGPPIRPVDLVYVRLLRGNVCLLFSKGSKCD
jgi:hypothetical protein